MSRRVSLPGADELFRPTEDAEAYPGEVPEAGGTLAVVPTPSTAEQPPQEQEPEQPKHAPSGRVRHDEKITVYVTADELFDLEHTRLTLRRSHGLAVDRGRIVREAIHLVLADVEAAGDDSALVRRLRGR